jgi:hypothetical protein
MSASDSRRSVSCISAVPAALLCVLALPGCGAMGELAYHGPWSWVAGTVAVLAVVGFIVSRMRR